MQMQMLANQSTKFSNCYTADDELSLMINLWSLMASHSISMHLIGHKKYQLSPYMGLCKPMISPEWYLITNARGQLLIRHNSHNIMHMVLQALEQKTEV